MLLSAISIDANRRVFPLAFTIVEKENKSAWMWFFLYLKNFNSEENLYPWIVITNRHKGIIAALEVIFPESNIRYYTRHRLANVKIEVKRGIILKGLY